MCKSQHIRWSRVGAHSVAQYAVRWLLSDEADFVTGTVMIVDGGLIAA
ncbi:hypothetical protein PPGU19_102400 (plasmid) [Paraburkholderia sp. PGU19]|nr:hypothetical protein PPGU19_102400 [Paraburkholderia sp. PGU19]